MFLFILWSMYFNKDLVWSKIDGNDWNSVLTDEKLAYVKDFDILFFEGDGIFVLVGNPFLIDWYLSHNVTKVTW